MPLALTIVFWLGSLLLVYTFLGYPVLIHLLGCRRRSRRDSAPPGAVPAPPPLVSIVLVARNEAARIERRLRNLVDTKHPLERLEIIVVSDGSTDDTPSRVRAVDLPAVSLLDCEAHRGKPSCLNDGVDAARGELVVFADARQDFTPTTIPELVSAFSDPAVGAVSGELLIGESRAGVAAGVDAYWRLEKAIRAGESRLDSSIGCTGAIYAIRRRHFQPLPADTILDDVVCPMQIALAGLRVLFHPAARAFDPQPLEPRLEARRKRRTLAGNFQMLFRYPGWLLPWQNRLWAQLVSHKYLRLAAPFLMAATLASCILLAVLGSAFFLVLSVAQGLFYACAAIGILFPRGASKIVTIPAGFLFLNCMTVLGLADYITRRHRIGW